MYFAMAMFILLVLPQTNGDFSKIYRWLQQCERHHTLPCDAVRGLIVAVVGEA